MNSPSEIVKNLLVGSFSSGVIGFTLSEVTTGKSAAVTVAAMMGGGLIAVIPHVMRARREAFVSRAQVQETATTALFARIQEAHKDEIEIWREMYNALKRVRYFLERALLLARASKHKALNECQRMLFHIHELELKLREKGVEPPIFHAVKFDEILAHEDDRLEQLMNELQLSPEETLVRRSP